MTQRMYRAWINQPSTAHPLFHLHGQHCIAVDTGESSVRIWFTHGSVYSMEVLRNCICEIKLSASG